jgi:Protein of unknown function, DUF547
MRNLSQALLGTMLLLLAQLSLAEVNHGLLDGVLKANVKEGQVNYPGIAADKSFATYLEQLAAPATLGSKPEKLVYYMNAYNALTIQGILDGKSPSTFLGRQNFFKLTKYKLAGEDITLDTIEHGILRKLDEPRVHFSIVCASSSCPKIRPDAYTSAKLEAQLDENARSFINDTSRNRYDKNDKTAYLSQIFKWFEGDFVKNAGSVQKFIAKYAADRDVAKELAQDGYKIKYNDYNWDLNGSSPGKR